jgi:hypothetical protein
MVTNIVYVTEKKSQQRLIPTQPENPSTVVSMRGFRVAADV